MNTGIGFQIVCANCGCLGIRIENPEQASREANVYCGDCGVPRGTMGTLRDLSVQPGSHAELPATQRKPAVAIIHGELVAQHKALQSNRRKAH